VVSVGTSGTVFAVTADACTDVTGTVAGFADASGGYLPIAVTLNAARVLSSIAGLLDVDFDGLGRLALDAEPGAGGVVLVPYFEGERTPNLPEAKASTAQPQHRLHNPQQYRPRSRRRHAVRIVRGNERPA
jgi:xylulokinase